MSKKRTKGKRKPKAAAKPEAPVVSEAIPKATQQVLPPEPAETITTTAPEEPVSIKDVAEPVVIQDLPDEIAIPEPVGTIRTQDRPEAEESPVIEESVEHTAIPEPEQPITTPDLAEAPLEIELDIEEFASAGETQAETKVSAVDIPPAAEKENAGAAETPKASDRRAHPRYAFVAAVEVVAAGPGTRLKTRVRDLSRQGCYVDTDAPLPLGTDTEVRITKGTKSFEARARVVYNQPGKGMGLMFTALEPAQSAILDAWISESRETSWLAANRRRSQRVLMKIPVRVSGQTGTASFAEDTHTLAVSAHGASLVIAASVSRGQRFSLLHLKTKESLECVVAHIGSFPGEQTQVGVEFLLPNPAFWRVAFPPKDWTPRHPDAKSV
jgi:PilZ domain